MSEKTDHLIFQDELVGKNRNMMQYICCRIAENVKTQVSYAPFPSDDESSDEDDESCFEPDESSDD